MNLFTRDAPRQARRSLELDLQEYNRRVLQHQDEAFALAADLLGDEAAAAEVVQAIFVAAFSRERRQPEPDFRWEILRRVIQACRERSTGAWLPGPTGLQSVLAGLSSEEKVLLVLVDRLELSYPDAATVLRKPLAYIRSTLCMARRITISKATV